MALRPILTLLAVLNLAQGVALAAFPREFYDAVANFGPYGPHYLRDMATTSLALAAGFAIAAVRPAWRLPVLCIAAAQSALHALNHFMDIPEAETATVGWGDALSLLAITAVYGALISATGRSQAVTA